MSNILCHIISLINLNHTHSVLNDINASYLAGIDKAIFSFVSNHFFQEKYINPLYQHGLCHQSINHNNTLRTWSLQWGHLRVMESQITGTQLFCSIVRSNKQQKNQSSRLQLLCKENPPVTGGFPSQKSVMRKADTCYSVDMNTMVGCIHRADDSQHPAQLTLWCWINQNDMN